MKLVCLLILALTECVLMENCSVGERWIRKDKMCVDEDECKLEDSRCGNNATCTNTKGSYYCQCHEGFKPPGNFTAEDSITCEDINECFDNSTDCGLNTQCFNTKGSYYCVCNTGYNSSNGKETFTDGQGVQCIGVCDIDTSICGEGTCNNSKEGHECICKSGFTNYGHKKMKCTELSCKTFIRDSSQAPPELTNILSLMTNSCLLLNESKYFSQKQVDGEALLKAFLDALDELLRDGFQANNHKLSKMFGIVEGMLKLIGSLLNNEQTRRSTVKTEVELLVERSVSPPEGPLMLSTDSTQFISHWETATGKVHLGFTTAALLGYKSVEKSLNGYFDHLKGENMRYKINSKVVTAVVSNTETNQLEKPVTLTFSHLKHINENHICVFWDPEQNGGAWSTHGCTTVNSTGVETICSCNHLSTFAVLMALYDIGDIYELRLITYVGLSLSLICLLICIATFTLVRSIQSTRNTIHLHLCITLFIAFLIFLVGITHTENEVGCAIVAGMLHYFFLAAFCWMCLEGVQLFRMVVLVFNTTVRNLYLAAAGYGVPAVIVAVSAIVNSSGYGTRQHCWLNVEDGSIWSFYGPVCVIIIVNVFFFLITIWKLAEKFSSLNPDLNNLRKIRTFTITAIAQLCVLGIMWVFGCFQFNQGTLAMSYIFTILGSLQGVLMFILHCWLSKQVRDEYVTFLSNVCAPNKRKYSEFSSQQTSKSQASKSVQNTGESSI